MEALEYLRKYVTPMVDNHSKEEVGQFRRLCTHLCLSEDTAVASGSTSHDFLMKSSEGRGLVNVFLLSCDIHFIFFRY
jgi:hypothetical protein